MAGLDDFSQPDAAAPPIYIAEELPQDITQIA